MTLTISPESDTEVLKQFELSAQPTVHALLKTIRDEECELYVFLVENEKQFVTEVLNIDWNKNVVWLGTPYNKRLSTQCSQETRYAIVSFPDGVKIQFNGTGMEQEEYQGAEALKISLPHTMARLQRREYFRVMADEELNHQVRVHVPCLPMDPKLVDLSLAGCGLLCYRHPSLQAGNILRDVRIDLMDGEESILMELHVKNLKNIADDPQHIQVGCELKLIQRGSERRLQRFLLATERRQRALHATQD
jgi:c-di-GMP-binding flagellar brake protein YcgR